MIDGMGIWFMGGVEDCEWGRGGERENCLRMNHRSVDTRYSLLACSSMQDRLL